MFDEMEDSELFNDMDPNMFNETSEYKEDDLNMFDDSILPFEETQKVEIDNNIYYKKSHNNNNNLYLWNELYGHQGKLLRLNLEAFTDQKGYDYFPELGEEVNGSNECFAACKKAYEKLLAIGYKHIDLFDKDTNWYNCSNVRKLNNEYYPIDVSKIMFLGGKKTKKRNKNKTKKRNKNKTKKRNKNKKQKSKSKAKLRIKNKNKKQ